MCFLEREVYAFLVSGFAAQCRGPAFFCLWGGRRNDVGAGDGPAADGSWAAREELADKAAQEERHARGVREKGRGLFWGKIGGVFACPPGGGRGRSVAIAALGIGVPPQNAAGATAARSVEKPSLWRPVAVPAYPAYTP